jgi:superfamily II DNA or RNA helicase
MNIFKSHYNSINYPIAESVSPGLRRAQIGAIHAIASHFTLRNEPAIVTMPTGSGKTAVLMMAAYVLRATRVLVITPSRLVRRQIAEEFENLLTLKKATVFNLDVPAPSVYEVEGQLQNPQDWQALTNYDVVVGIPKSISPVEEGVATPPEDLFDLILVDEAHHSPATTWNAVFNSFPKAKRVLFTATPFRRDQREIKGKLVYSYPVSEAYTDGIFGSIEYLPVTEEIEVDNDTKIAQLAAQVLAEDRSQELDHLLMVRTDSKKRAKELKQIYEQHTSLKLQMVDSDHSWQHIKKTIERLRALELDGIICVDMLGEGFDLPQLKIAAIHAPHKSLAITLQFIGRFARTNAPRLGTAKFIAEPSSVEGEVSRLYKEGAIWQEIIKDLSQGRIDEEVDAREFLEGFASPTDTEFETADISLHALRPYHHVKVYQIDEGLAPDLELELPDWMTVVFRQNHTQEPAVVFITRELTKPEWADLDLFLGVEYHLFVVFYDAQTKLLFINTSQRSDTVYEDLAMHLVPKYLPRAVPLNKINKVLLGLVDYEFFNIGMRNRMHRSWSESYRTIAGPSAQRAIQRSDGRLYNRGHIFARAKDGEDAVTIGYSSSAKVWSNTKNRIPQFTNWCRALAQRIHSDREVQTFSGLDFIRVGETVTAIPSGVIAAEWDVSAFNHPLQIRYRNDEGAMVSGQLLDRELLIDREASTDDTIRVCIRSDDCEWLVDFSLNSRPYFTPVSTELIADVSVERGRTSMLLIDYLNTRPPSFFFADFSSLQGAEHFKSPDDEVDPFDSNEQFTVLDWPGNGVDINTEFGVCTNGLISVHDYLKSHLPASDTQVVFYDHGSGEVADFVTFTDTEQEIYIRLFHCKKAGGSSPGKRVDDLYEVCGQAVKCLVWMDSKRLEGQLLGREKRRNGASTFLKGDKNELQRIIKRARIIQTSFEVIIVQPGVSRSSLPIEMGHLLATANDYLIRGRSGPLRVWASD